MPGAPTGSGASRGYPLRRELRGAVLAQYKVKAAHTTTNIQKILEQVRAS
jgi:hypothetical protein